MNENENKCPCGQHDSRKEHNREWSRNYWRKNRIKFSERKKQYYQKNKEKIIKKRMDVYYKDHDKGKLDVKIGGKKFRKKIRSIILWYFNYRCNNCEYYKDARALQLDHINGGGSQEQKSIGPISAHYYNKPDKLFEKFQLLCANCNYIKRIENGEIKQN